ncbi:MAG: hypothetical protein K9M80_02215 [Candidatus Marinimicrobia bacterium]|nr:hypothetical protein [Candidatus Neomarinimicrobiota bacterium]
MQNSDNIYRSTNLHILESKIEELFNVIKNLKEKNKDLQGRIDRSTPANNLNISNSKKRKLKEKIENMIEELDSVL